MRTLIPLSLILLLGAPALADGYTFDDLRALERQEGWEELLLHAKDVAPRERNAEWEQLVEKAAIAQVAARLVRGEEEQAALEADTLLKDHAFLKRSRRFLDERAKAGLAGADRCLRSGGGRACVERLEVFVRLDAANAQLAFEAGKRIRLHVSSAGAASMFAEALARKPDAALRAKICKDDDVEEALRRAFGQPPDYDAPKAARQIAFAECFGALKPVLLDELVTSGSYAVKNLCPGLAAKKALTPFQAAYCKDGLAE